MVKHIKTRNSKIQDKVARKSSLKGKTKAQDKSAKQSNLKGKTTVQGTRQRYKTTVQDTSVYVGLQAVR